MQYHCLIDLFRPQGRLGWIEVRPAIDYTQPRPKF